MWRRDTSNTLRYRFGLQLPAEFASHDETSRRQLKRLINECFQETLAVYSGHRMVGYISVSDGAVNRVHPGSSLIHVRGALPRFVIAYSFSEKRPNYHYFDLVPCLLMPMLHLHCVPLLS